MNVDLLTAQILEFQPKVAVIGTSDGVNPSIQQAPGSGTAAIRMAGIVDRRCCESGGFCR
ncbi:MAG: hypothetical protein WDO73_04965 [Ignavibacteriota bacterium]